MAISASVTRGFTFATGVEISAANLNELGEPTVTVATPIAVGNGGTNATSAGDARTNLGLGTIATQDADDVAITGGDIRYGYIHLSTIILRVTTTAAINNVGAAVGWIQYVSDGDGGSPCLAVSDGTVDGGGTTVWKRVALGAAIST